MMAYNEEKLTKLKSLKQLAQKIQEDFATKASLSSLSARVDDLASMGGEPNAITAIKVNGNLQTIDGKAVDISVPTKTSELGNDSDFQTEAQVNAAVQTAVAAAGHATFEQADTVPTVEEARDHVLYLVMNTKTGHYDIYAKVGEEIVLLDDTTVDLSGYVTKEEGKGLSSNDFTNPLKSKLEHEVITNASVATDAEVAEMLAAVFGGTI